MRLTVMDGPGVEWGLFPVGRKGYRWLGSGLVLMILQRGRALVIVGGFWLQSVGFNILVTDGNSIRNGFALFRSVYVS